MQDSYLFAILTFVAGILCLAKGFYGLKLPSIDDILFVGVGYILTCWAAFNLLPSTALPPNWIAWKADWVVKAINFCHGNSLLIGGIAFAMTAYGAYLAWGNTYTVKLRKTTAAATDGDAPTQQKIFGLFIGLLVVFAGLWIYQLVNGVKQANTPLTELATAAREHDVRFGKKFFPKEHPFTMRIPASFLDDKLRKEYLAEAEQGNIDQKGEGTLVASDLIAIYPSSKDGYTIDEMVIEFAGKLKMGTKSKKMIPTGNMIAGSNGMQIPELQEKEVEDEKIFKRGSITIAYSISAAESAERANALRSVLEHDLQKGSSQGSTGKDTALPEIPRRKTMPGWTPVIRIEE